MYGRYQHGNLGLKILSEGGFVGDADMRHGCDVGLFYWGDLSADDKDILYVVMGVYRG